MELYLIKHLLDQSIEEKKLYSFYEYNESTFYCGYVLSYNSDYIQIQRYTKYGESDGIMNLMYDNIRSISIDGNYIACLRYLIEFQEEFSKLNKSFEYRLPEGAEGYLPILNECLNDRGIIVMIDIGSESYTGFVDDVIGTSHFIFTEIDSEGFQLDTAIHKIEDLRVMRINDKYSRKNLFLYNWRKSKNCK